MIDKENKWIKFYPSLKLPKERVSIAYDTHDERKIRYAYGYFQFHNGNCSSFWKDGNEQPKVVKAEDIKYWMPVPSLDVQEEPVSDLEEAATSFARKDSEGISNPANFYYTVADKARIFKAGANWKEQQMMAKAINVSIAIPYPNGNGGYSRIVDSKEALPFGDNIKVLVIKEE